FLLRDWGFSDRCGKFAACAFFAVSRISQGRLQNAGMLALGIVLVCISALVAPSLALSGELVHNARFCESVGGKTETRHYYAVDGRRRYINVDCETDTHVYEGGLDKRSSLDSVQQATFASLLTGKLPVVVIYDTDGKIGAYEHRIRRACDALGIKFIQD
ncbi:MAG: hypothetical protein HRT36_09390, partial [Alphaproteobacteria bacterium]|nr:hypothetical protein [Alphaproteobacteria bacterium]